MSSAVARAAVEPALPDRHRGPVIAFVPKDSARAPNGGTDLRTAMDAWAAHYLRGYGQLMQKPSHRQASASQRYQALNAELDRACHACALKASDNLLSMFNQGTRRNLPSSISQISMQEASQRHVAIISRLLAKQITPQQAQTEHGKIVMRQGRTFQSQFLTIEGKRGRGEITTTTAAAMERELAESHKSVFRQVTNQVQTVLHNYAMGTVHQQLNSARRGPPAPNMMRMMAPD